MSELVGEVNENIQVKNGQEKYDIKMGIREWKRYPEYKDSGVEWIGEIPKDWNTIKLKFVSKIVNGSTPNSAISEFWDGEILWITPYDLGSLEGKVIVDSSRKITRPGLNSCGTTLTPKNSIILSTRAPIGHIAITSIETCTNQGCKTIVPNSEYNSEFLYYNLYVSKNLLQSLGQGSTFIELSSQNLKEFEMNFPFLEEQQNIVSFLNRETSKIDTLIEKKQRFIELLEEKRSALISYAVTKGLDPDVKMKDSGVEWIGEIPESWDIKPFRRICTVNQGLQIAQSERFYEPTDTRLEYITIKSIHDKNAAREYIENPPKSVVCHQNDILLARTGATGEVITNQEGVFHNNFFLIKYDSKKVYRDFLVYYLKNKLIKSFILLLAGTTTIPDLNHGDFLSVPFVSQSFEEQQIIVNFLDRETEKIDAFINKISAQIEKLKEYRTALISAAVTGKIDVREEVA